MNVKHVSLVLICVVFVAAAVAPAQAELQTPPHLITGHGGVGVPYIAGQWSLRAVDDGVPFAPEEALFYVNQYTTTPAEQFDPSFHPWLGTSAGQMVYWVPQTLEIGLPFFGFNLNGMSQADKDALAAWDPGDPRLEALHHDDEDEPGEEDGELEAWVQIDLVRVRGLDGAAAPGEFALWSFSDEAGAVVWMSTAQTPAAGNRFYLDVDHGHSHVNWAFTAPGVYELEFQATTRLASAPDVPVVSPVTTFYFGVLQSVPEPSVLALLPAVALAALALARRRGPRR